MVDIDALNAQHQQMLNEIHHLKNQNRLTKVRMFAFSGGVIVGAAATLHVLKRFANVSDSDQ